METYHKGFIPLLPLIILAIIAIIAFAHYFRTDKVEKVIVDNATTTFKGMSSYENSSTTFKMSIPTTYGVPILSEDNGVKSASFSLPSAYTTNTNLFPDSKVVIAYSNGVCDEGRYSMGEAINSTSTEVINGNSYNKVIISGAGAGNIYYEELYMLAKSELNRCYAVKLFLHSTHVENYADTVHKEYNHELVMSDFRSIINSFAVTQTVPSLDDDTPVITSLSKASGPVGTILDIDGVNLAGFEGDLIIIFKRADGKITHIKSLIPYGINNTNHIQVKVAPPCKQGETVYADYSGIASKCDYFEFTPGVYKIYTEPWGKKSNEVEFTVK